MMEDSTYWKAAWVPSGMGSIMMAGAGRRLISRSRRSTGLFCMIASKRAGLSENMVDFFGFTFGCVAVRSAL